MKSEIEQLDDAIKRRFKSESGGEQKILRHDIVINKFMDKVAVRVFCEGRPYFHDIDIESEFNKETVLGIFNQHYPEYFI